MKQVIVLEDHEAIRNGVVQILRKIDESLEIFDSGYAKEGLRFAKMNQVAFFVVDIQLLDYSGMEFVKEIRNMVKYKMTPVVFLTAIPNMELEAYRHLHCYSYLIKPFKPETAEKVLKEIICFGIQPVQEEHKIKLKQRACNIILFEKDILYVESVRRKIEIATVHERIKVSGYTLKDIAEMLSTSFVQIHRGYIVNEEKIARIDKKNRMVVIDGAAGSVPYGDKYIKDFEGAFL